MRAFGPTRLYTIILIGSTVCGWLLRLPLLDRFPFREDEAIYSYWALYFWRVDPFFLQVWPDKPPLFIGLLALFFQLFGANQISAQWLNIAISTATIPVVAALAQRCWGQRAGAIAALTFALNPFAISFAATAYTDPLLVLAGLLAFYLALVQRPFWAGLWLALAIMTKQQGVLYIPLVVGALFVVSGVRRETNSAPNITRPSPFAIRHSPFAIRHSLSFLFGLALVLLPILYWDSLRWSVAPSPWDLSIRHYGALTLLPPGQWPGRFAAWLPIVWHLTASWPVWILLVLLICSFLRSSVWRHSLDAPRLPPGGLDTERRPGIPTQSMGTSRSPCHLVTLTSASSVEPSPGYLILLWSILFLLVHTLTSVQPWDRYLLPLAPMLALGIGWLAARLAPYISRPWWLIGVCTAFLMLMSPALQAANGRLPIGGDHGAYQGLVEAIDWVKREEPPSLVLYHRALGWHYRFYLYDQVESGAYDLRWFPNAVYLAANAAQAVDRPRVLIEPDWASDRNLRTRLAQRNLEMEERARFGQFTVYRLVERRSDRCRWCYCGPHVTLIPLGSSAALACSRRKS